VKQHSSYIVTVSFNSGGNQSAQRENHRSNQKWIIQRNWKHRVHRTKKNTAKTQHNMCRTTLHPNRHEQRYTQTDTNNTTHKQTRTTLHPNRHEQRYTQTDTNNATHKQTRTTLHTNRHEQHSFLFVEFSMFGSSLPPVVCRRARYLFALFMSVCV
jgi:hypothetical protein